MELKSLENYFKIFQFLGLQFFSLKFLHNNGKYRSKFYRLQLALFITGFSIALAIYLNFAAALEILDRKQNDFNFMLGICVRFMMVFVLYASLILSFTNNSTLMSFFKKSEKISKICLDDFNRNFDLKSLKRKFTMILAIYAVCLVGIIYLVSESAKVSGSSYYSALFHTFMGIFPILYSRFIPLRLWFYVQIINCHLQNLKTLIRENFLVEQIKLGDKSRKVLKIYHWKICQKEKIRKLQRIFKLIKEMSGCVNESMGFLLMFCISHDIISIIRTGYRIFINDSNQIHHLDSKRRK
jgi:hypothetical protein